MVAEPIHPRDAEAAEYVLGTLPLAEREAFGREMAADSSLAGVVRSWEERLVPLADQVPPLEPSATLWASILAAIGQTRPETAGTIVPWPAELVRLRRSRALWRGAAVAAASMAAALALFVASPNLIPSDGSKALVAVVNRSGELPALIVRVDQRAGTVQVRAVQTETPAGQSLELWSIVGTEAPHSLGILAPGATRVSVPAADRARLDGATIAVTVEPAGGSPTGGPTGPVVYSGKLFVEAP
ncbi:anti-sigma factor domain-containing protein [uncultured Enterovirga sp.]|uniref:anti-sigma factor n=1 Tax=uncultured Enterovirga sp. TaxID=2026352 RepID=UPI0035CA595D